MPYTNAFLVRDNLSDVGNNSLSPYWVSPDIICLQQGVLPVTTAVNQYSSDLNLPFVNGQVNNFYIRGKNISSNSATGTVSLWYSPTSLFLSPQSWTPINLPTASATFVDAGNSTTIAPGEVCLTTTPFVFTGVNGGGHFCLIAAASTNGIPYVMPTSFSSNAAMALWVQSNPNISQRNLGFPSAPGNIATLTSFLGNTNNSSSNFIITVTPGAGGVNYPAGTSISVLITDGRLSGGQYAPPAQPWSAAGVSFIGLSVPANVNGSAGNPLMALNVTITLPSGSSFAGTGQVSVNYYQVPAMGDDLLEAQATRQHNIPSVKVAGEVEAVSLIELGICTFNF